MEHGIEIKAHIELHLHDHANEYPNDHGAGNDHELSAKLDKMVTFLQLMKETIMQAITDYAAAQNAFNDRQDTAIADLAADIKNLNDQIAALQATPTVLPAEDQALLDGLTARGQTIADKLDALDALTPPVIPAVPAA